MQPPKEDLMVQPCDICGALGWIEAIFTCSKCNVNREHAYCMRNNTIIDPKDWLCEPCQSKHVSVSTSTAPRRVNQDIGSWPFKRQRAVKTGKVKFLDEDEVIRLSSRKAYVGSKNVISKVPFPKSNPRISPPIVLGKLPRNDEAHKKPMTNHHASCSLSKGPTKECMRENPQPLGGVIPDKKVQTRDPQKERPTKGKPFEALSTRKSSPIVGSGGILSAEAVRNKCNIEKSDLRSIQENSNLLRKFLPSSIAAWRGQFQILQTAGSSRSYDGFEAQPPCIVNRKAYKFSTQMPSVLQLESHPVTNVLTDVFCNDPPKLQDIALYFFPSQHTERSRKNLNSILKFMNVEKSMLRSYIEGVELLVFTSNELEMESRGAIGAAKGGDFLWGIFGQSKTERVDNDDDEMGKTVDMDVPPGFEECLDL
ncbi:hypothetical protein CR513_38950, partial [Mucuna pruriens]